MNRTKIGIVLGIVCLLLTSAIVIQTRSISSINSGSDSTYADDGLRDEVLKLKEKYENEYKELEEAEEKLEEKRAEATENDTTSTDKKNELKIGEAILGTTEVTGKGVIITVNDSQTVSLDSLGTSEDASNFLVHYDDLIKIVNELKNAGAEAISINDQRIISTSTIECAGNIIRVNGERVGAPFIIKAIGNQNDLYYALSRVGGYLDILSSYKLETDIKKPTTNITIVKYNGVIKTKYMKEAK